MVFNTIGMNDDEDQFLRQVNHRRSQSGLRARLPPEESKEAFVVNRERMTPSRR